jgi:anti-anti-sigma factor
MNDSPLAIHVEVIGPVAKVTVRGDVSASRSGDLEDQLLPVVDGPVPTIEVDVSSMTFLSSTGLAVLVRLSRRARQGKRAFVLVRPSSHIERMLRIANLSIG